MTEKLNNGQIRRAPVVRTRIDPQDAQYASSGPTPAQLRESFGSKPSTACCSECNRSWCDIASLDCHPKCNECILQLGIGWTPGVSLKAGENRKTCLPSVPSESDN